jgi:hypothetical protein
MNRAMASASAEMTSFFATEAGTIAGWQDSAGDASVVRVDDAGSANAMYSPE